MTTTDTMSTTTGPTLGQPIHDPRPEPQTIPCAPWCERKDTSDESCIGQEHVITLSLHNRVEWSDGQWTDEWAGSYACTHRTHVADPGYIHLGIGESAGMRLTPAEARSIAAALLATADEMEGRR